MSEVRLRPPLAGERPALVAMSNRANEHDGIPQVFTEEELDEELDVLDEATDVRVAEVDGTPVGYLHLWFHPSGERLERAYLFGTVDPPQRRRGAGRALLGWGIERATEAMHSTGNDLPKFVRVDTYDVIDDARRLHARMGFRPVRWFEELLRPLADLPPVAVDGGYELVDWPVGDDDEVRLVRNAAFADHWGSTPWSAEHHRQVVESAATRLDLSVVARERATGRVVGFALNEHLPQDEAATGRREGWISVLGTLADHRGRGIASALLAESMRRFAGAGLTHAAIGVDGDSPTGAHRLYRAVGFELLRRSVTSEIDVTERRALDADR